MATKSPFWTPWPLPPRSNVPYIIERRDYDRGKNLHLRCTQLNDTASEKKRILNDWCEFFRSPSPVRTVNIATRCPQQLFDAVCNATDLTALEIHWGSIEDLSPIRNLKNLQRLRLGSCSVTDLSPIKHLKQLEHLSLGNLDRLSDYTTLGSLKKLQFLEIEGAPFMPKHVWIDDLKFIRRLPQLQGLSLTSVRFHDDNYHLAFRGLPLKWLDLCVKDSEIRNAILSSLRDLSGGRILAKSQNQRVNPSRR
jgi:Leucine Rich repeats (2 copies)